ncbi:glycoside hydrolase family 2 TIM barrel-domain containing protein [Actinomadura viridis]|uniref:beta-galactosidase n=1 Tax=Actinomadura viridis TaxID=58110 RepID=A0A931DLX4_9ACTN|nr:glycoside hydrolase family 2 TIM barrel-domain containing protein [Actinomadura viridis]MBG6091089.1 beta-galactosidase [Actinomadura viridis]
MPPSSQLPPRSSADVPRRPLRPLTALVALAALVLTLLPGSAAAAPRLAPPPDVHTYLDDPEMVAEGQEPAHSVLRPGDERRWTRSLDGEWRLKMAERPGEVPAGFHAKGYDTSAWPRVKVPHTWQSDRLDHPVFRNIPTEVWPDDPPRTPRDINPTGAYVKTLDVPEDWDGRRTFLRFEGVTSAYLVWVNGAYVGYDQGGYTPAEFDVTDHVRPGGNTVAVQVHRWSAGSYLEDVDQWRYSGIFRSVWAYSTPKTYVRDASITTDLDASYRDATLNATLTLAGKQGTQGEHTVKATLLAPDGRQVTTFSGRTSVSGETATLRLSAPVSNPAKWSDETPSLYTLRLELSDPSGRVTHTTTETVGFREIEIKDRQLLVNGKRILIKGVNRPETDPDTGRHQTRERQEADVALMKRLNINAIRTAHYPSDPYLYELADRRGLWIDDEVDIETHNYEDCTQPAGSPRDCLADRPEWQKAFLERFQAMVARDKNHPSVIMWDTGNEAGLGAAHTRMAEWATATDPTRPLYHQPNRPDGDAPFAHVWGPRYPTPARLEAQAAATTKPIIMGEYAHAMGNSLGNFREFWEVVRRHPQVQGGFIWDWAEANLRHPLITTPDASGNDILAWLQGMPKTVDGRRGKALYFSGLDDFVEVYRDRKLDLTGNAVTLDAWVKPARPWTGDFTMVTKGDHQYGLKMSNETTLEFYIHSGGTWRTVRAPVPSGWYDGWHRVTGAYDGTALRLYVNGREAAQVPYTGTIDWSSGDVNIGRNSGTMQDNYKGRMAHGTIDDVRIYGRALTPAELGSGADPAKDAVLALNFDDFDKKGTFLSNGQSLSGVDGLVGTDRYLQPELAQLAWVHSPIRVTRDAAGKVTVSSERAFSGTSDLRLRWSVTEGRRTVRSGEQALDLPPGGKTQVTIPAVPGGGNERWLNVDVVLGERTWYAPAGHVVGFGQFPAGGSEVPGVRKRATGTVQTARNDTEVIVTGRDFRYVFDRAKGTLTSMRYQGTELVRTGPELDVWRPPISNETYTWGRAEGEDWRKAGLDRLVTRPGPITVTPSAGSSRVTVEIPSKVTGTGDASFDQTTTYAVDGSGQIELSHQVVPQGSARTLPYLARVGYTVKTPDRFTTLAWYGRGPVENYNDRKDGTRMGVWSSSLDDQYVSYYRPQDHGNHDDVRWAMLTDGRAGLLVGGDLEVSATRYDDLDRALYPFARKRNPGWNTLHVNHAVTGVGDTPNPVRPEYQVRPDRAYSYSTVLRPLSSQEAQAGAPSPN